METIAIIGASTDRRKYGNKAVRAYAEVGWTVYPVNRREDCIEGIPAYRSVLDVPRPIQRVSLYVPPLYGERILSDIREVDPGEVWLNPGAESDEILARCKELGLHAIVACSIIDVGSMPD
jgi:predicted CoA-binding protein